MKTRCRFGWHAWPKWGSPERAVKRWSGGPEIATTVQRRTCPDCGLNASREVAPL